MDGKRVDRIVNILYFISAFVIMLGVFFRIQHYPHGNYLVLTGTFAGILIGFFKLAVSKYLKY